MSGSDSNGKINQASKSRGLGKPGGTELPPSVTQNLPGMPKSNKKAIQTKRARKPQSNLASKGKSRGPQQD